tara:strand:+ start:331 stop:729 length:399 start_codon:yes stop_codon:yes gene_type:complete
MKLTTARLKKLIREELERINERTSDLLNFDRPGTFSWNSTYTGDQLMADVEHMPAEKIEWKIYLNKQKGEENRLKYPTITVTASQKDIMDMDKNKAAEFLDQYVQKWQQETRGDFNKRKSYQVSNQEIPKRS